jgi:hypothetical protein
MTRAAHGACVVLLGLIALAVLPASRGHAADPAPKASASAAPTRPRRAVPTPAPAWKGPRVELSYRLYSLRDSAGGGLVQSAAFSGFLPTRAVRAGGGLEAGARSYDWGPSDGLLSGNLFVGYQHLRDLGRVVPYAVAVGELGVVLQKRYHSPLAGLIRGAGVELGADINLVRSLYVGVGLTFMLYTLDDLFYDTFGLRVSIGL